METYQPAVAEQPRKKTEGSEIAEERELHGESASEIARLRQELLAWQHDGTGAFKGDRLGSDIKDIFESREARPEQTHLLVVNMGELDRFNDSGDHALGDRVLKRVFEHLNTQVVEGLPGTHARHFIYRTAGADFSIVLQGVSSTQAQQIERLIAGAPLDVSDLHPDEEPAELTCSRVAFSEAQEILQHVRPERNDASLDANVFISILKEKALTLSDFERTRNRLNRVIHKMTSHEHAPGLPASTVYEKYHKTALGPLFAPQGQGALGYSEFAEALDQRGVLENVELQQQVVFDTARQDAIQKFHSRNRQNQAFASFVLREALERMKDFAPEDGERISDEYPPFTGQRITRTVDNKEIDAFEARAEFLQETTGESVLEKLEQAAHDSQGIRPALLLQIERLKRDRMTGLTGKDICLQNIQRSMESKRPISVISVDMAFLKLFDKEGGKYTGDAAIKTAARILDYVARTVSEEYDVAIEVHRVGGDEFTFSVGTDDTEVLREIEQRVRTTALKVGPIPALTGAFENYYPETLQFNLGTYSVTSPDAFAAELAAQGIEMPANTSAPERAEWLASQMYAIADRHIGPVKTANRLVFLLSRGMEIARAPVEEKSQKQMGLRALMDYSDKAIFGDVGKKRLVNWQLRLNKGEVELIDLIRSEIVPFVREQYLQKSNGDAQFIAAAEKELESQILRDIEARAHVLY